MPCQLPLAAAADRGLALAVDERALAIVEASRADGGSESVHRRPPESLRPHVVSYQGYRERTLGSPVRRHPASGFVPLIIGFEAPLRHIDSIDGREKGTTLSFVAGMHDRFAMSEMLGVSCGMQVNLTPLAARALLNVPMHRIANSVLDLEDALRAGGRDLNERLATAPDWDTRFEILDEALAARFAAAQAPSEGTAWAWRQIAASGGRVPIGLLTQELGWSRKRLVAEFRDHIGLPPKLVARIMRFRRAATLIEQGGSPGLAHVALQCGYYDQAHFVRDFRQFSGATPGAHLRSRFDPAFEGA
jgi:AraC-like DNA-binding protein